MPLFRRLKEIEKPVLSNFEKTVVVTSIDFFSTLIEMGEYLGTDQFGSKLKSFDHNIRFVNMKSEIRTIKNIEELSMRHLGDVTNDAEGPILFFIVGTYVPTDSEHTGIIHGFFIPA